LQIPSSAVFHPFTHPEITMRPLYSLLVVFSALAAGCDVDVHDSKPDVKVDTPKRDIEVHVDSPRVPKVDVQVDR
jgi:hypothetical protein